MVIKYKVIVWCCVLQLFCLHALSAHNKVSFGAGFSYGLKTNKLAHPKSTIALPSKIALFGSMKVEGDEYSQMGFVLNAGFALDNIQFKLYHFQADKETDFGAMQLNRFSFLLNPEVMFKTRLSKLQLLAGVGLDINFASTASEGSGSTSRGGANGNNYYLTLDLDTLEQLIKTRTRNILPFVNMGVVYQLLPQCTLKLSINQQLMNLFERKTLLHYQVNQVPQTTTLNYTPLTLSICAAYYFN